MATERSAVVSVAKRSAKHEHSLPTTCPPITTRQQIQRLIKQHTAAIAERESRQAGVDEAIMLNRMIHERFGAADARDETDHRAALRWLERVIRCGMPVADDEFDEAERLVR